MKHSLLAQTSDGKYVVTGITGQVGGAVARALLGAGLPVRGVVRDAAKGKLWQERGCEIVVAAMDDSAALAAAFHQAEGVFILPPSVFDPAPDFAEARAMATVLKSALEAARPRQTVYLSTIGAQSPCSNLLSQHTLIEQTLRSIERPIAFLRPAWFMENCSWDVAPAMEKGIVPSFLQPLDRPFPMVATADIGRLGAELLQETWSGHRIVELEAAARVTPDQIAAEFAAALGKPIHMEVVPRLAWPQIFASQGMKNPAPRIAMLEGFNEGWIEFEQGQAGSRKGTTTLRTVIHELIRRAAS